MEGCSTHQSGFLLVTGGMDRKSRPLFSLECENIAFFATGWRQDIGWLGENLWVILTTVAVSDHLCAYPSHSFLRSTKLQGLRGLLIGPGTKSPHRYWRGIADESPEVLADLDHAVKSQQQPPHRFQPGQRGGEIHAP